MRRDRTPAPGSTPNENATVYESTFEGAQKCIAPVSTDSDAHVTFAQSDLSEQQALILLQQLRGQTLRQCCRRTRKGTQSRQEHQQGLTGLHDLSPPMK